MYGMYGLLNDIQFCITTPGGLHKPRGQLRGGGVSQMTISYHKPYLVEVTTNVEGDAKIPKILTTWFMNDPPHHTK